MSERDAFLHAIGEAWDDPTPVLVFADWAEEHGTDEPPLLRWYGAHVMPALAAVPDRCPPATEEERGLARDAIRPHPQADALLRLAALHFVRRKCVWDRRGIEPARDAARVVRLRIFRLIHDDVRWHDFMRVDAESRALLSAAAAAAIGGEASEARRFGDKAWVVLLARELLDAAGPVVAVRTALAEGADREPAERGWQAAVYRALAAVPPLGD
jgi:uncharacterized protein (TIGR02996 family)